MRKTFGELTNFDHESRIMDAIIDSDYDNIIEESHIKRKQIKDKRVL